MGLSKSAWFLTIVIFMVSHGIAFAHKNHVHQTQVQSENQIVIKRINAGYLERVKPIFQKKCFDCHSDQTHYPWYANSPLVKGMIQADIQEARKHLDFSHDFPFQGHGAPKEDLEEVLESVTTGDMPPLKYRLLHWRSKVTQEEIQVIRDWVTDGKKLLGEATVTN